MAVEVTNKKANGLVRKALNQKLKKHCKGLFNNLDQYMSSDIASYKSIDQLAFQELDSVVAPNVTEYLANKNALQDSSKLAAMGGGNLFQILRVYRDIIYTNGARKDRLLWGIRGSLCKAKSNKVRGTIFI